MPPFGFDHAYVGLHGSFAFAEAVAGPVAAAQAALAHTAETLYFPDTRLQANAGDVLPAFVVVEVIHLLLIPGLLSDHTLTTAPRCNQSPKNGSGHMVHQTRVPGTSKAVRIRRIERLPRFTPEQ